MILKQINIILRRCLLTVIAGMVCLGAAPGYANIEDLPDIGSPADAVLSRKIEAQIGRQIYSNLVQAGAVVTDPELAEYIQSLGMRLVSHANRNEQRFQFFIVNSPVINAFALPGGYIGIHTGLLLATEDESELAGVIAHEISHVTQRHISRAVFANQRASTLSMAAMLGAILVGVATGVDPGLISGAVTAAQGMSIEQQISFTRSNEKEADRVGLNLLAEAGFDPMGMPDFFETMGRSSATLSENKAPEFLLTHPLSSDRMAETRDRARNLPPADVVDSMGYPLARARVKLLTSTRPEVALEYFREEATKPNKVGGLEVEYGIALTQIELGKYAEAEAGFTTLLTNNEEIIPFHTGLAISQVNLGKYEEARETFIEAMDLFPRNVPLTVRYAETLLRFDQAEEAHEVLLDLLNQVPPTLEQIRLIALAANAAGDTADAHYYMAEYHAMSGNLRLAIDQLKLALATPDLDSVQDARFKARLKQFQEYLPTRKEREEASKQNGD